LRPFLLQIPHDFSAHAKKIFAIVSTSRAPVSIRSLQYTIAMDENHTSLADLEADLPFDLEDNLRDFCGYLLEEYSGDVIFYYHLAYELFVAEDVQRPQNAEVLSKYRLSRKDSHKFLAELYLSVLRLQEFRLPAVERTLCPISELLRIEKQKRFTVTNEQWLLEKELRYPLFFEALCSWDVHFTHCEQDEAIVNTFGKWLSSRDGQYLYYLRLVTMVPTTWPSSVIPKSGFHGRLHRSLPPADTGAGSRSVLHFKRSLGPLFVFIAEGDHPSLVRWAIRHQADVNEVCCGERPQEAAMRLRRSQVAGILLEHSSTRVKECSQLLHLGLKENSVHEHAGADVVKELLSGERIDVNALDTDGQTPLHVFIDGYNWCSSPKTRFACKRHEAVWRLLMETSSLRSSTRSSSGVSPFVKAFDQKGNENIALSLMKREDAVVDHWARTAQGNALMVIAEAFSWWKVEAEFLGRWPSLPGQELLHDGFCPLTWYAYLGNKPQVLKYLRATPSHELGKLLEGQRWNLVSLCAHQDWEDVVILLQNKFGFHARISDHRNRNLLHWIVDNGWDLAAGHTSKSYSDDLLNLQDSDGKTALHIAVETMNVTAARWLIDAGARFRIPDNAGRNAAHVAADVFCRRILNLFLDHKVREFGRDNHARSLLHYLAKWSDQQLLLRFCRRKRFLVNVRDRDRRTPLHYACLCSNVERAEALLGLGAAVNAEDSNYCTPLHYAIRNGNKKLAQILIFDFGARMAALNCLGQNCQQLAAISRCNNLVDLLADEPFQASHRAVSGRTTFHILCSHAADEQRTMWSGFDSGVFALILARSSDTNATDRDGRTPLHIAASRGCRWLVHELLKLSGKWRVNVSPKDRYGCTPLDLAQSAGHSAVTELLTHCGAYCTAGRTAMKAMSSQGFYRRWDTYVRTLTNLSVIIHPTSCNERLLEQEKSMELRETT
jgi:ankyrin repeat protein